MKKLTLLVLSLLFITVTASYAEEKEYEITRIFITLEERKELMPDILNMTLSVNVNTQKEAEAVNMLGVVDKAIRGLNVKYSGGSYSVYKNCWWEKNKTKCSGYKGDIGYSFELKEAKEQNRILDAIDALKEKYGEKMDYTVSHPQWLISTKNAKAAENELKYEIIDTAKDFAKKAGEKLGKICSISSIDYEVRRPYFWDLPVYKSMNMEKAMMEAPEPKKEEKTLNVKASIRFICR
ncbi:SIMPL domain-containing protein [Thermodesulfovibrio sp. 3907-1M]|uniref:SIMPL domain-containing protein n=1 Tax=Thermodesulfovibrio autotrophicus TaxID=3118333 RepID=A0AAU8GUB7_9BACT